MTSASELVRNNPIFKAYFESSIFRQLLANPILSGEFGNSWVDNMKGDLGPLSAQFLASLERDIEPLTKQNGYRDLKKKIKEAGEEFFPTIFEIQIASLFKRNNFPIQLERTFSVSNKDNNEVYPDLRIKTKEKGVYYEMTDVLDYKNRRDYWDIYNAFFSLWRALRYKTEVNFGLTVRLSEVPDIRGVEELIEVITKNVLDRKFPMQTEVDDTFLELKKGEFFNINLPAEAIDRKLRDKYYSEIKQFDPKEINVIVVEMTSIIGEFDSFSKIIHQIFEEDKRDIVNEVFLIRNRYTIQNLEIVRKFEGWTIENGYAKKFDYLPHNQLKTF